MKTRLDPRHKRREEIVKSLFRLGFNLKQPIEDKLVKRILEKKGRIDKIITGAAPEWPIGQINKVDLAILRLAIYELICRAQEPPKVIIDEAVELAKTYGSEKSPGFINGVLGTVFREYLEKKSSESGRKS